MTRAQKRQTAIDYAISNGCDYILERIYFGSDESKSLIQPVATYSDGQDLALQLYDQDWDLDCTCTDDAFLQKLSTFGITGNSSKTILVSLHQYASLYFVPMNYRHTIQ